MAAKPQWWICHTVQQCTIKTENTILSANFAKAKNVKPGAYENKVLKCIPGYTFSNNQLLHVEIAFKSVVTVWSCDQVVYGCGLSEPHQAPGNSPICLSGKISQINPQIRNNMGLKSTIPDRDGSRGPCDPTKCDKWRKKCL